MTTIISPLTISPLCLLLLVRLGGYIVNCAALSSQLKSRVGLVLDKAVTLRMRAENSKKDPR
jgi:hypothetical protein